MTKEVKSKRNTPLIAIGALILVLATALKAAAIGLSVGVMLDILQVAGIIVALIGFGVPWTRKK